MHPHFLSPPPFLLFRFRRLQRLQRAAIAMAVPNTCATGLSTFPFHQLRPSLSTSSCSISSDINFSYSQIKNSATFSFPRSFFHSRNSKKSKSYCLCSKSNEISAIDAGFNDGVSSSAASDWDWNRWTRYFSEIEQAESYASLLKRIWNSISI